jgi:hypothetical protein
MIKEIKPTPFNITEIDYSPEAMSKKMIEIVELRTKQKHIKEYYRILKAYKEFY